MQATIKRILFFLLLIGIWQGIVYLQIWPESMIPSPFSVFRTLYLGFMDMSLVYDLIASFRHLLIGLAISIVIGTALGILLATVKSADETLGMMILALQSVPSIVWVPLAIIWFGFGETAIIFVVVIGGTFVMTMNIRTGVQNVSPIFIDAGKTMGAKGMDLFLRIVLSSSIQHSVTGIRLAWGFSCCVVRAAMVLWYW